MLLLLRMFLLMLCVHVCATDFSFFNKRNASKDFTGLMWNPYFDAVIMIEKCVKIKLVFTYWTIIVDIIKFQ